MQNLSPHRWWVTRPTKHLTALLSPPEPECDNIAVSVWDEAAFSLPPETSLNWDAKHPGIKIGLHANTTPCCFNQRSGHSLPTPRGSSSLMSENKDDLLEGLPQLCSERKLSGRARGTGRDFSPVRCNSSDLAQGAKQLKAGCEIWHLTWAGAWRIRQGRSRGPVESVCTCVCCCVASRRLCMVCVFEEIIEADNSEVRPRTLGLTRTCDSNQASSAVIPAHRGAILMTADSIQTPPLKKCRTLLFSYLLPLPGAPRVRLCSVWGCRNCSTSMCCPTFHFGSFNFSHGKKIETEQLTWGHRSSSLMAPKYPDHGPN